MNKQQQLRKTLDFLAFKDMQEIDFTIVSGYSSVNLSIQHDQVTESQLRVLKRHFGPFEVTDEYGAKGLQGVVKLDEFNIQLNISRAYTCETLNVDELTESKWDEIKEHARHGRIKLQDCKAVEAMVETKVEPQSTTSTEVPF